MAPFYGWGSTASRLQPLRGGSLLFTIQLEKYGKVESVNTHNDYKTKSKKWTDTKKTDLFCKCIQILRKQVQDR